MNDDMQFETATITRVEKASVGYSIGMSDGWSFFVPDGPITPEVGHEIRLYGKGTGYPVRGIVVNGHVFSYRTEAEEQAHQKEEAERREREAQAAYDSGRTAQQADIAKLPAEFQSRMNGFMERAPGTAWRNQGYELATCQAALAILSACEKPADVGAFRDLPWDKQMARVPALDALGLSGNQFGMACRLAHHALAQPENVWKEHATICPLIGCREAGCHALTYA